MKKPYKVAYKLKKEDIAMLEKAGLSPGILSKGDYVACRCNYRKETVSIELFPDEELHRLCIHSYKPLEKDQIAFSFLGEKYYDLDAAGKDVWKEFAKKIIKTEALFVLDRLGINTKMELVPEFHCDGTSHQFEGEDDMYCPKNVTIDTYLASAADLAVYGKLAEEVEELSFKLDKHSKKLTRVFDEIYRVGKDSKKEVEKEDDELDLD